MRVGKVLSRLRLSLIACLAVAAFAGVLVGSASAAAPSDASGLAGASEFNPQETNVPYLAWRGENVRLVKCVGGTDERCNRRSDAADQRRFIFQRDGFDINMSVYEYSGPQENSFDGPKAVQNEASVFEDGNRICVRGTWISNKAGIVVIKLTVSYNGVILGQHDFLIGWMADQLGQHVERRLRHRGSGRRAWQLGERSGHGLDPAEPGVPGRLGTPVAAGHAQRLGAVGAHDGDYRPVPR